jgi:hypothetical protein
MWIDFIMNRGRECGKVLFPEGMVWHRKTWETNLITLIMVLCQTTLPFHSLDQSSFVFVTRLFFLKHNSVEKW